MPRLPDPGPLPRPFGTYQLVRRIAVGGMAEVYVGLARGVGGFEKLVALKLIHPGFSEDDQFVRMLIDEAKLAVLLTDANIAQVFDLGVVDGRYYIVLEFVDGVDVSKLLDCADAKRRRLPIEAALFIMARVCHALDYAHRKTDPSGVSLHVIHRDVSPQNVLLSFDGEVKLTDFGIAKAALRTSETEVGVIKGKYCYMSPEQAWADPIDHRSDIFSAGAVLYELLTSHMLFSPDENLPALLERVRKADVSAPSKLRPEIPKEIDAIVLRALARSPSERYSSAGDFASDLERTLWLRDRTWGAAKLQKLMNELVPVESEEGAPKVGPTGRTSLTKIEGEHTKMNSREFMPEASSSVLFRDAASTPGGSRVADAERDRETARPASPTTVKDVVEKAPQRAADPRVESNLPPAGRDDDDEEEMTTFFQRPSLDVEVDVDVEVPDADSTLVDRSGDILKKLAEMNALGAPLSSRSEPIPAHFDRDDDAPQKVVKPFHPPAPKWSPLPFVGPPLEAGDPASLPPEKRSSTVAVPKWALAATAVGFVAIVAALLFATR